MGGGRADLGHHGPQVDGRGEELLALRRAAQDVDAARGGERGGLDPLRPHVPRRGGAALGPGRVSESAGAPADLLFRAAVAPGPPW